MKIAAAAGFVLIAFFWISHFLALDAVFGFSLSQFKLVALLPLALSMTPLFAAGGAGWRNQRVNLTATLLILVGASALASQSHGFSADNPRPLNFVYYDDKSLDQPEWLVAETPADESFFRSAGFAGKDTAFKLAGLVEAKGRFKPTANANLPAPSFTVDSVTRQNGLTLVTGHLTAARSGFVLGLGIPPGSGIRSIRAAGQLVVGAERLSGRDPVTARLFGLADHPIKIEIEFDLARPAKITLLERSPLPDTPDAKALLAARPLDAAPVHSGDGSLVFQQIDLATLKPASSADPQVP